MFSVHKLCTLTFFCVIALYALHVYLQVQQSVTLDWQVGDVESFGLQNSTWVQNTFMLCLRGDHMAFFGLVEPGHTLQERERESVTTNITTVVNITYTEIKS